MNAGSTRQAAILVAALLGATACAGNPQPSTGAAAAGDSALEAAAWVEGVLPRLTLEDRVAQLIVVRLDGRFANTHSGESRQLERFVSELHVGGVLVSGGTPIELAAKLNSLQRRAPLPLLVLAPEEWSEGRTVLPPAMGLAATGVPLGAELAGRVAAREARAVGIHWLLGPSADVAPEGAESALDARNFSSDPALVARYADAWARGARAQGVLGTLLHFPGSGRVLTAERALPVIEAEREQIEGAGLVPFGALVRMGIDAVLVGHAAVPAITGDRTTPASLSPAVATDLLRRHLRFDGIALTAPLSDPVLQLASRYAPAELAVEAFAAGADVVLAPEDAQLAHRMLVAAVRSGRIPYSRVEASVRRILMAKARLALPRGALADLDSVAAIVGAPQHDAVAARLADESITLTRDSLVLLPLDPRRVHRIAVIGVAPPGAEGAGAAFAAELQSTYGSGVSFDRVDATTSEGLVDAAVTRAGLAQAVILATFEPLGRGEDRAGVALTAKRVAQRLHRVNPRVVLVTFGDAPARAERPAASTHLLAWQPEGRYAQAAAARAIAGRIAITGRMPAGAAPASDGLQRSALDFTLARARPAEAGMDSSLLRQLDYLILRSIAGGATPGAALAVGRHGRIVVLRGYGQLDLRRGFDGVTDSTLYDLASLTKVVATTSALAILVDRGVLDLDRPVQHYVPEWRGSAAKNAVTLRNLVLHDSGLPAYAPLYESLRGREEYRRRIAAMELTYAPGTQAVYSDFGIILLGLIVEQVTGETLDVFLERELFRPLGMRDTGYNPKSWPYAQLSLDDQTEPAAPPWLVNRIAPTELDTVFRFRQVHGEVHDENAFAMGGVAGHAGLFSSARDLAVFAQMMLNRGFYGGRRFLDPATVEAFTRRQSAASSRAIGWDTPTDGSSAGAYFTPRSYGHTGFTGTSIWLDPERDVFVVLLTNRVNLGRENQQHVPLRSAVADIVQRAITDMPVTVRRSEDVLAARRSGR